MQHPPQNNMPVPGGPGGPPQQANGGGPPGHDDSYFTEVSLHFLNISLLPTFFNGAIGLHGLLYTAVQLISILILYYILPFSMVQSAFMAYYCKHTAMQLISILIL